MGAGCSFLDEHAGSLIDKVRVLDCFIHELTRHEHYIRIYLDRQACIDHCIKHSFPEKHMVSVTLYTC